MTNEVVSCYNSGQSLRTIAARYKCGRNKIKAILENAGVSVRTSHQQRWINFDPGQSTRESIISKYLSGMSMTKIGKELNLGISIVRTVLKQAGHTIKRSNYCLLDIDQQELERLYYDEQKSTYELSQYFGCSDECLRNRLPRRRWYNEVNKIRGNDIKKKISESCRNKWLDGNYANKVITGAVRWRQSGQPSKIQALLYQLLDDLNVDYYPEGLETTIGFWTFDCLVKKPTKQLLIECQGTWVHSRSETESRDKAKFTYINNYFGDKYEIMYVWEDEFYTDGRVLDRLKLKLGVEIQTCEFEFKDVDINPCPTEHYRSFLDAYHYIGKGRGGKCLGAYLGDQLIACCAFSPPLRQNLDGVHGKFVELSRFCIHPSYHKKNFASWFISKCLKHIDVNVVAYADTTVGHIGTIYKAANFILHHIVPSDYWYVDEDGYIMHKLTLYRKAKQISTTEAAYAVENGYSKKYGGEKLCYVYKKKDAKK